MQAGFIGLGKMGRPMTLRLLAAGYTVHVFNRSRGAVDALVAEGATAADSAAEVGQRADVIMTALPTPESVQSVYTELAANARAGQVYVDHSTVSPGLNRWCAEQLEARGADFLDAPVSGGPAGAQAGTLTVMVGGEQGVFEQTLPVLQAFGKNIRLCGPVGAGQVVKLINQLLVGIHTSAIAEAAVFGARFGADPQVVLDLIGTSFGGSTMMTRNLPRFMSRDFSPATPVGLILKDLGLIHDEAKNGGVPLLLGALAEQRFSEARARGMGDEDMAALVKLWEEARRDRGQEVAAHMPHFAANLSMLWPELDVYERFGAAAAAGFSRVEILFVHALDHDRVARVLKDQQLELVLFDPYPGNWDAGERGLLSLPGREAEFLQSIRDALRAAKLFGTGRLNAIAGVLPPGVSRAAAEATAIANLRAAAPLAQEAGVLVLVENINTVDMPGYVADTADRAAALVQAVDHPSVRLQLDQYHVGMMGGDPLDAFRRFGEVIEHVQIADVPGRHEPGTGQQPIDEFLSELDKGGYTGAVGLEYRPSADTDAALAWLPRDRRG